MKSPTTRSAGKGWSNGSSDIAIVQVKPDRFQDWLDVMRKATPIMEKAGAKNARILVGLVAGEQTGTVVV